LITRKTFIKVHGSKLIYSKVITGANHIDAKTGYKILTFTKN
jgi:hypothetical protein